MAPAALRAIFACLRPCPRFRSFLRPALTALRPSPAPPAPVPESAPSPDDSDAALVARAVQGQTRAYELLVIKYQRRIERLIGRMVRDVDLVQDIAQETFINAWHARCRSSGARRTQ